MMTKILSPIASGLLVLSLLPAALHAADKVPPAMQIPVNSTTTPAATTDKNVTADPTADNTSRNSVHNGKNAVTADQQSSDKGDVEITRKIRQSIVKDKSLSTNAHNVKIITVKGSVVLKGPVASNDEKMKIEQTAATVAGKDKIVSEIEVQTK